MSLFSSHERYVGIEIASSAVKIVELENIKGRPKLITYGYVEQQNAVLNSDSKQARDAVIAAIHRVQRESRTTSINAVSALPSYTVFTSIIHLPQMPKKELTAAVQWEAKKFVPMPLSEMIVDWKILENNIETLPSQASTPTNANGRPVIQSGKKKFLKILLTAAPKSLVTRYMDIFKQTGLNLVSLETESFALERALVGNDKSPIMIIDMGATATTISIVVSAVPLINRSIDIGGHTITKAIANSLNIDMEHAEQFKRDFGLTKQQNPSGAQVPRRIEFMMNAVINEITYVLNLYKSQGNGGVGKVILAGGSAWLPNITQYLSQALGVKVYIGDPWARVMYPVELRPVLQAIGPRMAVAIGLAMREIA